MKALINNKRYENVKYIEVVTYTNGKLQLTSQHISMIGNGALKSIVLHSGTKYTFDTEGLFYFKQSEFVFMMSNIYKEDLL